MKQATFQLNMLANAKSKVLLLISLLPVIALSQPADAFCGFYVGGAGAELFNNATQVVMMRDGTRTVLSMQNNYQGPPENFAMVVPVPVVLQKDNVKTLPANIFARVDRLAAPRLVEYWEQDPCAPPVVYAPMRSMAMPGARRMKKANGGSLGVKIEAQFKVGEYEIVILSAKDSTGLDTWLRREKYHIPKGAEPLLRPYVQAGSKFFVAKVDTKKVTFAEGMAMLSPLRFHYDSDEFRLPIRLGLINAKAKQDLIVHILARGKRYEVANRKNVTIPTNLDVKKETSKRFGEFYATLFDRTLEQNPGAVITEYAWDASTCDPCPSPALNWSEMATLGTDVLFANVANATKKSKAKALPVRRRLPPRGGFVLTRLHARYGKNDVKDDLIFREAGPIVGGREIRRDGKTLEQSATKGHVNNFQGRYAIRHPWTGPITCKDPVRNRWGGPPSDKPKPPVQPALKLAFAPRGKSSLRTFVAQDVPELKFTLSGAKAPSEPPPTTPKTIGPAGPPAPTSKQNQGKGCSAANPTPTWPLLALISLLPFSFYRRRQSSLPSQ